MKVDSEKQNTIPLKTRRPKLVSRALRLKWLLPVAGAIMAIALMLPTIISSHASPLSAHQQERGARLTQQQELYKKVTSGKPIYSSDLTEQDQGQWDENSVCGFQKGAYVATLEQPRSFRPCQEQGFGLSDLAFQVEMTINSGSANDGGGLLFRDKRFRVSLDGSFDLANSDIQNTLSSAIHTGLSKKNLLTVIAQGENIFLYVNKQFIA